MIVSKRVKSDHPCCPKCKSLQVRRDAVVEWDPEIDEWVVYDLIDELWCDDCGAHFDTAARRLYENVHYEN